MKTFRITASRELKSIKKGTPPTADPIWCRCSFAEARGLPEMEQLNLPPLIYDAIFDGTAVPRVMVVGNALLVSLPVTNSWQDASRSFLHIVCTSNVLLTIQSSAIAAIDELVVQYTDGMRFHDGSTSAVLYHVLDFIINKNLTFTHETRNIILDLEEQSDSGLNPRNMARVESLRRSLTRLEVAFDDQLYCLSTLHAVESAAFSTEGLHDYFRDALFELEHTTRVIDRQKERLVALRQSHELRQQDRFSSQLRVLTIISTIFLPLTLLAGIYGMNFDNIPELHWPNGYFFALAAMFLTSAGMLVGFWRSGWFRS